MPKGVQILDRNMYMQARQGTGLCREEAAHRLYIGSRTLARFELGQVVPPPDIVLRMVKLYRQPALSARYCSEACPIGQISAYPVEEKSLPAIVLGLIKEHNDIGELRNRLIAIAEDGVVSADEVAEFERILDELLDLEQRIEAIKLWAARILPVDDMISKRKKAAQLAAAR